MNVHKRTKDNLFQEVKGILLHIIKAYLFLMYICSSSKGKRAQVFFDLVFNGQITREEIEKILRAHSTYEDKDGLRYFKFRDFIVDINKILNPPVLPTRGPDIEIIGTIAHRHIHSYKNKYEAAGFFSFSFEFLYLQALHSMARFTLQWIFVD